jgi:hypothetical protein
MAEWLAATISVKLQAPDCGQEWVELKPFLAQNPKSRQSTISTMMDRWLFEPPANM